MIERMVERSTLYLLCSVTLFVAPVLRQRLAKAIDLKLESKEQELKGKRQQLEAERQEVHKKTGKDKAA